MELESSGAAASMPPLPLSPFVSFERIIFLARCRPDDSLPFRQTISHFNQFAIGLVILHRVAKFAAWNQKKGTKLISMTFL